MDYNLVFEFMRICDAACSKIDATIANELQALVPRYKEKVAKICETRTDKPFNFIDTLVDQHIYQDTKIYIRQYNRVLTSVIFDVGNYLTAIAEDSPEQLKGACLDCINNINSVNQINKFHIYKRIPIFIKPFVRRVIDTYKSVLNSEEEKKLSKELKKHITKQLEKDVDQMVERIQKNNQESIDQLEQELTKISDFICDQSSKKNNKLLKEYNSKLEIIDYQLDETYNSLIIIEPNGKKHRAYIDGNQIKTADNNITISVDKDLIVLYNSQNYYKFITINNDNISIRNNETTISIDRKDNYLVTWNRTPVISLSQKYFIFNHIGSFFPTIFDLLINDPKFQHYYKKCRKTFESNKMFNEKGLNPIREKEVIRRMELLGYKLTTGKKLKVKDSKGESHDLIIEGDTIVFEDNPKIRINLQAVSLNKIIEFEYIFMNGYKNTLISNANLDHFELFFDYDDKVYIISIEDEMIIGEIADQYGNKQRNDGLVIQIYNDFYPSIVKGLHKRVQEIKESIPLDIQIKRLEQTQDVQQYLALINKKLKEEEEKTSKS